MVVVAYDPIKALLSGYEPRSTYAWNTPMSGVLHAIVDRLELETCLQFDGPGTQSTLSLTEGWVAVDAIIADMVADASQIHVVEKVVGIRADIEGRIASQNARVWQSEVFDQSDVNVPVARACKEVASDPGKRRRRCRRWEGACRQGKRWHGKVVQSALGVVLVKATSG